MSSVVADTHTAIWQISDPGRLSLLARQTLRDAAAAGDPVFIASVSIVEMRYLVEKSKIKAEVLARFNRLLDDPNSSYRVIPLDLAIARAIELIPRATVPDMPDRIIAATALILNLPLVSRDRKIQSSSIQTIW